MPHLQKEGGDIYEAKTKFHGVFTNNMSNLQERISLSAHVGICRNLLDAISSQCNLDNILVITRSNGHPESDRNHSARLCGYKLSEE